MFLGHLYVQLDILQSDEDQAGSCHMVTTSVHSTILQHLLYKRCARHLAKCRSVPFAKEKYQSCLRVITDFCSGFEFDFPLAFRWASMKPIDHPAVEFFDKGVGFSWKAYRNLSTGYTCVDAVMGPFVDTAGTTTPLTGFEERGITYLATTNARWLPYLSDEGVKFMHYPTNRHADDYPAGWEKRVKVTNILVPTKKIFAKSKSTKKKGDGSSETCSDIAPFKSDLPPISNIFLESFPPPSTHTHSSKRPAAGKSKPTALWPSADAPPSSRTRGSKRKTSPPLAPTTTERRSKHKEDMYVTRPIPLGELEFEPEPIFIYHPTVMEISASMGSPIEGFFDGVDMVFETTTSATPAAAQGVPVKAPIPSAKIVPIDEGTHTERVSDTAPTLRISESIPTTTETPTPQKGATPPTASQTEVVFPAIPLVISTSDPFMALSQAVKDGSYLVVTPSFIPSSTTQILEEHEIAADTAMPTATFPATPAVPVSATPTVPVSAMLSFEVGSSSATVPDHVSEAAAFFTRFDQPKGSGPPYVDFHDFRVPKDHASHLEAIYGSHGDFIQGFRLSRFAREHFLKLLGSVMNDIGHKFVNIVSTEKILQWRATVQELVSVGFAVEFILNHLHEIAQAFFMKKVQPTIDVTNTRIEALRKEVVDLEARNELILSSIGGSSRFGDRPLISGLR
ncbi:hypothetical protein SO802_033185 [Lithocarpus litseifolius]|uniref:Uncharacterized protein n=1 Tax=Lithocarpus litseifolius TaxID=425828 RepID=A0AAW2BCC6_9ROSI